MRRMLFVLERERERERESCRHGSAVCAMTGKWGKEKTLKNKRLYIVWPQKQPNPPFGVLFLQLFPTFSQSKL